MNWDEIAGRFRVTKGEKFRLRDVDPRDTCGIDMDKGDAKEMLAESIGRLTKFQEKLYAQDSWALLVMFQAMDAAGKDGAIKHVMSGVNPQGCQVSAFKVPSAQELDHDFLWRTTIALPERGRIGIFNRSYYEEVLVVRVHEEYLVRQRLPQKLVTKRIWDERFEDIRGFERYIGRNGIRPLKIFLHVSKEEQRRRFIERLDDPDKRWKFSMSDIAERKLWDRYMEAYEEAIRATATPDAPWYVVPADQKWFTRLVVAGAIVDALESLDLGFPKVSAEQLGEMATVRRSLGAEGGEPLAKIGKPKGEPADEEGSKGDKKKNDKDKNDKKKDGGKDKRKDKKNN
ncbi:MAG: polyphosphate kinase 2 family protein [Rhizobiales bacterium]|nr:polyphosphate kinase 2 family protein [Hyphomicrobiales bacterium]